MGAAEYDIIVITGPTATGKTRLAARVADRLGSEVISADSRQVYRGMDIGTGKDLSDFSVVRGYRLTQVPVNEELRRSLDGRSLDELTVMLSKYKRLHNKTDVDTVKRAVRAIEIEEYYLENPSDHDPFPVIKPLVAGILFDRDIRRDRITRRLKERLDGGMIEEVQRLLDAGIHPDDLIYYGLEYKYVTLYLLNRLSYTEMYQKLETEIHRFAKRQMTWFRGMERRGITINWIDGMMDEDAKLEQILEWTK